MRVIRSPFLAAFLALCLILTGQAMAQARGQSRNLAGQIVLCTGAGAVSMAVDAQGNPVGPVHICPDCVPGLFAGLAEPLVLAPRDANWHAVDFQLSVVMGAGASAPAPGARAPPA